MAMKIKTQRQYAAAIWKSIELQLGGRWAELARLEAALDDYEVKHEARADKVRLAFIEGKSPL